jgi:hypothetical protein
MGSARGLAASPVPLGAHSHRGRGRPRISCLAAAMVAPVAATRAGPANRARDWVVEVAEALSTCFVLSFFWADAHKEQEQAQTRRIHPALTTGRAAHSIEAKAVIRIEVAGSSSVPLPGVGAGLPTAEPKTCASHLLPRHPALVARSGCSRSTSVCAFWPAIASHPPAAAAVGAVPPCYM